MEHRKTYLTLGYLWVFWQIAFNSTGISYHLGIVDHYGISPLSWVIVIIVLGILLYLTYIYYIGPWIIKKEQDKVKELGRR